MVVAERKSATTNTTLTPWRVLVVSTLFSNSHPSLSSDVTRARDDVNDTETTFRARDDVGDA